MPDHESIIKIGMDVTSAAASLGAIKGEGLPDPSGKPSPSKSPLEKMPSGGFGPQGLGVMQAAMERLEKKVGQIKDESHPRKLLPNILKGMKKLGKDTWKGLFGGFTVGALLRQSQIFTATAGAFFQIAGAMIDTILAPLAPHLSKVIQLSATLGIATARKVAKGIQWAEGWLGKIPSMFQWFGKALPPIMQGIANAVDWFKNIVDVWKDQGPMGVLRLLAREYLKGLKFMGNLIKNNLVDPVWNWLKNKWRELQEKAGFDIPEMKYLGVEGHRVYFLGKPSPRRTSALKTQKDIQSAMAKLEKVDASDVMPLDITQATNITSGLKFKDAKTGTEKTLQHGFMEFPETAKDVMDNLKTSSDLVQDIYSGFHMDGETPGQLTLDPSVGKVFNDVGATGLKTAIQKIVNIVNNPTTLRNTLETVLEGSDLDGAIKNIAGGGGIQGAAGYNDDITNQKVGSKALAEISSSKLSPSDKRNFGLRLNPMEQ